MTRNVSAMTSETLSHNRPSVNKLFLFRPIFKRMLWGGTEILRLKGLPSDTDDGVGESWEISGIKGNESVVCGGPCDGMSLPELLASGGEELVGRDSFRRYGTSFPLLVKFIDASQDLSVQVHPNDELARLRHGCPGKTEMWYVVAARPGACLLSGFSRRVSPEEYERRVGDCTLPEVLQRHEVRAGDVFYLPAGRVHSIGAGCLICEIQQASDITYRIYDFGRIDKDGRPRPLHVEEAREAIDFSVVSPEPQLQPYPVGMTTLVSSPYFTTSLCRMTSPVRLCIGTAPRSFRIVVCTRGALTASCGDEAVSLREGNTMLVSASADSLLLTPHGEAEILECHI